MLKQLKQWFLRTFFKKIILLEYILMELRNLHYHFDKIETLYKMVNNIKEEEETVDKKAKN